MKKVVFVAACSLMLMGWNGASAAAAEPALDGYCPVCLVKMDKLVKGAPDHASTFDGRTYLFPGPEQKRMFDANPEAFVPVLGGDCTVCRVEMGKSVPGKPEVHTVHEGRLYLFPSEKQQRMFEVNPEKYADADVAMGGHCPVCLVKKDEVVRGKPEYSSIRDGLRYLFPGAEQKRMFDADPAAFTPAMGGNCTVCKVEVDKEVAGKAAHHVMHDGRLYLFPSQKQLDMFLANPGKYADADLAMDGYCAVCKVEKGKRVKGKEEFAVDYEGARYLFPGRKQRAMFLANPEKYTKR